MGEDFITTCIQDLHIALMFGKDAVQDTYDKLFDMFKASWRGLAELTCATNWICWELFENGQEELSRYFAELYYQTKDYAYDNLQGDDVTKYFNFTD